MVVKNDIKLQRRLAADLLKVSKTKVWIDPEFISEVKEATTREDIRKLIEDGVIVKKQIKGTSRARARKLHVQKIKGRRRGHGSRKGTFKARNNKKRLWINKIRKQRSFLKELKEKEKIDIKTYRLFYLRAKGGAFRSLRHLKLILNDYLKRHQS